MIINLLNLSSHSNKIINDYKGSFETCNFRTVSSPNETNSMCQMLNQETKLNNMNNKELADDIRAVIQRHLNDIDSLAKLTGKPVEVIKDFMNGTTDLPDGLFENVGKNIPIQEYFQLGDKIEINNTGKEYTNNFAGMLQGIQKEEMKKMKAELSDLKKMLKEKEELIESLKENIRLLQKQK